MKMILILSANPNDTVRFRFDQEFREIKKAIRLSKNRNRFVIRTELAVRVDDLQRALIQHEPQIVHFSGHGKTTGLLFEDEKGNSRLVPVDALSNLFKLCRKFIKCVVLNTCYSELQAREINRHIDYVIGMTDVTDDIAAIQFASGFYTGLSNDMSYFEAFRFGCNAFELHNGFESARPIFLGIKDIGRPPSLNYIISKKYLLVFAIILLCTFILSFVYYKNEKNENFEVKLIVPSYMDGATVLVDDKDAKIISRSPTEITILLKRRTSNCRIALTKGNYFCSIERMVERNEIIYPCK